METRSQIYSRKNILEKPVFTYNGKLVALGEDFVYLGVILHIMFLLKNLKNCSLERGRKSMFSVLKKIKS